MKSLEDLRRLRQDHKSCVISYEDFFERLDAILKVGAVQSFCQHGLPFEDYCPKCGA